MSGRAGIQAIGPAGGEGAGDVPEALAFMQRLCRLGNGVGEEPASAVLAVADGVESGQPGIQGAGEGVGEQQGVEALVEIRVEGADIPSQAAQQAGPFAQGAGEGMHGPAAAGQQGGSPALAHQLQRIAVMMQVPEGGQAHDDIADPVRQTNDEWSHLWIIQ